MIYRVCCEDVEYRFQAIKEARCQMLDLFMFRRQPARLYDFYGIYETALSVKFFPELKASGTFSSKTIFTTTSINQIGLQSRLRPAVQRSTLEDLKAFMASRPNHYPTDIMVVYAEIPYQRPVRIWFPDALR